MSYLIKTFRLQNGLFIVYADLNYTNFEFLPHSINW
jgi:hypothetical protein